MIWILRSYKMTLTAVIITKESTDIAHSVLAVFCLESIELAEYYAVSCLTFLL